MCGGKRLLLAGLVAGLLGACADPQVPPPGGSPARSGSTALTGNAAADDIIRYTEYLAALTAAQECWSGVLVNVAAVYGPLLRVFTTFADPAQRDAQVTTARQSVDRATQDYPRCQARSDAVKLPSLNNTDRRNDLLRFRAQEEENIAQVKALVETARSQVNFMADGGLPTPRELLNRLLETQTIIARLEVRHREVRFSPGSRENGRAYNQARIHGLRAAIALLEHAGQVGSATGERLVSGQQEVALQRTNLGLARTEMTTLEREFDALPAQMRAPARGFLTDMRAVYDADERVASAMEDYFKAPELRKVGAILDLHGTLKESQDRAIRGLPDMLKRMLGMAATA